MSDALEALRRAPGDFAVTPDDIWDDHARPHVQGINETAMRAIEAQIELAERSAKSSVYGLPIVGEGGRGKSHLLGQARIAVQEHGGFFVRLNILHFEKFWPNLVGSYLYALNMPHRKSTTGLAHLIQSLGEQANVSEKVMRRILNDRQPDVESVSRFIEAVREMDSTLGGTRKTLRGLLLLHSRDEHASDLGEEYLTGGEVDVDPDLGITRSNPKPPKEVVRDLSHLMSRCGATVIAVDQVDDIVRASKSSTDERHREGASQLLDMLGVNLVDVRDETRRTTVILACLESTWQEFERSTVATVTQRFEPVVPLDHYLPNETTAAALIAAILTPVYDDAGFVPPYPSFPFPEQSLGNAVTFNPRQLLRTVNAHLRSCVAAGAVTEIEQLEDAAPVSPGPRIIELPLVDLDNEFERFQAEADLTKVTDSSAEFHLLRPWLLAGLNAYRTESGRDPEQFKVIQSVGERQGFHVEVHDKTEARPRRWSFRALATGNGNAVLSRVRGLYAWAKLGEADPVEDARGILWVTAPADSWRRWSSGSQVLELVDRFGRHGTEILASENDLKVFFALHRMEALRIPGFGDWLQRRRPASGTYLLRAVFGDPVEIPVAAPVASQGVSIVRGTSETQTSSAGDHRFLTIPLPTAHARATATGGSINVGAMGEGATSRVGSIGNSAVGQVGMAEVLKYQLPAPKAPAIGRRLDGGSVYADLKAMAKHTAVFAGSGSGKTVLLRRMIEAAALQGVSSIVLDPNNDLSRLGLAWPEPPEHWLDGDAAWAERYHETVETVVWTPGRIKGRPLSFKPLPDFAAVLDDSDEFEAAVVTAVDSLVPRARIGRATPKDDHAKAVLKEALVAYARDGSSDFEGFLLFLENLPDDASSIIKAPEIAVRIASTLRAAKINDRVFGGVGPSLDPSVLLTPTPGKRARISVVNFIGLPTEEQQQGFVNLLEMALFSWAKRNPARDRPLSGLLVLDEAQTLAPSSGTTICLASTLALASQARKYGLGMLFATQAPKGIHNKIVGNCGTHWYGRINAPAQIAAAVGVAQDKAGTSVDLARLSAGQFYMAADGTPTDRVDVPMCLTYHPSTAPTAEEILAAVGRTGEEPGE
ncbi:DUF87 domain-containing protein [Glycomyces sp. NPDC047010]|uniref:helicase HerA domain-containing protein n=1 Tax=Glycomyces sp. NPDC047010 TaxID=3155023 RepID=UPI0033DBC17E